MENKKTKGSGNGNEAVQSKRPRISKEELLERRVNMAKERNSRVLKINSPLGNVMFNVLRQFDQAYNRYTGEMALPANLARLQEVSKLLEEANKVAMDFSELTKKLCKEVDFRYYKPDELKVSAKQSTESKVKSISTAKPKSNDTEDIKEVAQG